ncbi:thioredoxin family protein [soil metagenome]
MSSDREIQELQQQIDGLKQQLSELRRQRPAEPISDYDLLNQDGSTVKLSDLFGEKNDLLVIHNMGKHCAYCTLWADGFNSLLPHLENRSGFVIVSPDEPSVQKEFAASRNWGFKMASAAGSSFIADLGFLTDPEGYWPGVSALHRESDGSITRTGKDIFGPGDDYNPPWRFFDLLSGGVGDWEPQLSYQ